ncbi:adenylyltransferase/cytidyltransferase family protein [Paenibacillus sp. NPDC058910]
MKAVYPGSFDPFTLGHLNILERATRIFDSVTVVIAQNSQKNHMFSAEQRCKIVLLSTNHLKNVKINIME